MKILLLLLTINYAFAENPQEKLKRDSGRSDIERPLSNNLILSNSLTEKNCGSTTTRKEVEDENGNVYDAFYCDRAMIVYIMQGNNYNFRILYNKQDKKRKLIELVSIRDYDESKKAKDAMIQLYQKSDEYKKFQDQINKRKQAAKIKKDQILAEKQEIINKLLN